MARPTPRRLLAWLTVLTVVPAPALAQLGGELEIHGFLLGNAAVRTTGDAPAGAEGSTLLLGEARARLELDWWANGADVAVLVKAELIYDAVTGDADLELREGYLEYAAGPLDLRLGRQIVTWGVGDLLFINDVFPKDWVSFFAGRPLEYLKLGVDGLRAHYASPVGSLEVVVMPRFEPDNLPTSARFFLLDPFPQVADRRPRRPPMTPRNLEVAARFYRRVGPLDLAGYAYRGFWRTPGIRPDDAAAPTYLELLFPRLAVYGASFQAALLRGVVSFEFGYYDSRQDPKGIDPAVPNSQIRFLLGYQRQLLPGLTVDVQYYLESMRHWRAYRGALAPGFPAQGRHRDTATIRLTKLLRHDTWRLSIFALASPIDSDYLLQPQLFHKLSDRLAVALGANLFGGERDTTPLGQLDRNDNAYVSVRLDF